MFCFSKTCRICKRSTNSFNLTCNSHKEVSNLFFSMFPELMNSKLNHFLKSLCECCVKQLQLFEKFKNHCTESDECYIRYLNQLEGHDGMHAEVLCELGIKKEDDSPIQPMLNSNCIQEAVSYNGSAAHSNSTAEDIQFGFLKPELCVFDIKEENEGAKVQEEISKLSHEEIRDTFTCTNQELITSNYLSSIDEGMCPELAWKLGIKQECCQNDDRQIQPTYDNYSIQEASSCYGSVVYTNGTAEDIQTDIVKREIIEESEAAIVEEPISILGYEESGRKEIRHSLTLTNQELFASGIHSSIVDVNEDEIYCIKETVKLETVELSSNVGIKDFHSKNIDSSINTRTENCNIKSEFCQRKDDLSSSELCAICKQSCSQKNDLMSEKPFECDICNKSFTTKSHMIVHKRSHTGEKPYDCNVCKKSFSLKSHLIIHKRTHTGEKPYECDICKRRFSIQSNLRKHKRTHTGEKPHECDICKKSFSAKSHLMAHIRTHTGEKPHECDICKKHFRHLGSLNYHKRTHTGQKPHECDVCKKSFSMQSNLMKHKRTHTGEKPYQCNMCKKRYSCKSNLNVHERTHYFSQKQESRCDGNL